MDKGANMYRFYVDELANYNDLNIWRIKKQIDEAKAQYSRAKAQYEDIKHNVYFSVKKNYMK